VQGFEAVQSPDPVSGQKLRQRTNPGDGDVEYDSTVRIPLIPTTNRSVEDRESSRICINKWTSNSNTTGCDQVPNKFEKVDRVSDQMASATSPNQRND
jgi:hypothetical protein